MRADRRTREWFEREMAELEARELSPELYDELLLRYPDQFVAVRDGDVVLAAPGLRELVQGLRRRSLDPAEDVQIEFLRHRNARLIL